MAVLLLSGYLIALKTLNTRLKKLQHKTCISMYTYANNAHFEAQKAAYKDIQDNAR